jgi:hypothetical protein
MQRREMKRWHEEYLRTHREWKKHYLSHVKRNIEFVSVPGRDPYLVDCDCDQQKGRFRKRRAWGCGRARCQLCHSYKFPKRKTSRDERRSELKVIEEIRDLIVLGAVSKGDGANASSPTCARFELAMVRTEVWPAQPRKEYKPRGLVGRRSRRETPQ